MPFQSLSSTALGAYGRTALALNPDSFKHAESANFIYHYFDPITAKQVAVESEFFFRTIAKDFGRENEAVEKKAHIFMLPDKEWEEFKRGASLDPWTGGMHTGNELFITRDGERPQGPTLGHEVGHLVVQRFFGDTSRSGSTKATPSTFRACSMRRITARGDTRPSRSSPA